MSLKLGGVKRTEIGDCSDIPCDLLFCVFPEAAEEVDDEVDGLLSWLWVTMPIELRCNCYTVIDKLTGIVGRRGSMEDSSLSAWGSKNSLNHSQRVVPGIGPEFLASNPHAITRPYSS